MIIGKFKIKRLAINKARQYKPLRYKKGFTEVSIFYDKITKFYIVDVADVRSMIDSKTELWEMFHHTMRWVATYRK